MELLRTLVLVLSVPAVDDAIPATRFITTARSLLVWQGLTADHVERRLGLRKFRLFSGSIGADAWYMTYLAPDSRYGVSVVYVPDPRTKELRLKSVKVKRIGVTEP